MKNDDDVRSVADFDERLFALARAVELQGAYATYNFVRSRVAALTAELRTLFDLPGSFEDEEEAASLLDEEQLYAWKAFQALARLEWVMSRTEGHNLTYGKIAMLEKACPGRFISPTEPEITFEPDTEPDDPLQDEVVRYIAATGNYATDKAAALEYLYSSSERFEALVADEDPKVIRDRVYSTLDEIAEGRLVVFGDEDR